MAKKLYKVLNLNGSAHHGGIGTWSLPNGDEPGEWMPKVENIAPCARGYHVCEKADLVHWIGPAIFEVEIRGETVRDSQKTVAQEARLLHQLDTWNETTARLFAADCAKYAVWQCEKAGIPVDKRVKECIRVVSRFARGEATEAELSAAGAAAGAAARSAAGAAAAWDAARAAARSAAGAAAARAGASVRSWQTKRLFEYLDGGRG